MYVRTYPNQRRGYFIRRGACGVLFLRGWDDEGNEMRDLRAGRCWEGGGGMR